LTIPPGVQGRSLESVLTTEEKDTGYEWAYIESIASGEISPKYNGSRNMDAMGMQSRGTDTLTIRNQQWRFTVFTNNNGGELYDLEKDPDEFSNVWDDPNYAAKKAELMPILLEHTAATRDPLPQRTKPY
jgi:hypothetical protein